MKLRRPIAALFLAHLTVSAAFAQPEVERKYKLDPNCVNALILLGRSEDPDAIKAAIPDPKIAQVQIIDPLSRGTGSIQLGKVRWDGVDAHAFIGYSKSKDGELVRERIGLIERVVTPGGISNVIFNDSTGKPAEQMQEVWIVRSSDGTHLKVAKALPDSTVFFIDGIDSASLKKATQNRDFILKKVRQLSPKNSTLVYALPRTEVHLVTMGFKGESLSDWRELADKVDSLKFRQFKPKSDESIEVLQFLYDELVNGRNVLLWAHSPDGERLAIPIVTEDGTHSVRLLQPGEIAYVQQEVAKETNNPGLLVINGCRVSSYVGLAHHLAGRGSPNVATREEFASANIEVLEDIAGGGGGKQPPRGDGGSPPPGGPVGSDPSGGSPKDPDIRWLGKLAGNLSILVAVGVSDDDDDDDAEKQE